MENNTKEIFKAVFSALWKYFLCFVFGAMVMANCKGCEHDVAPVIIKKTDAATLMKLDSLQFQNDCHLYTITTLKKRVSFLDSIGKILKSSYIKIKKDNRDFIQNNPCDSVGILMAYDATVAKCDTVIQVDSLKIIDLKNEVNHLESVNKNSVSMLQIKENQLTERDIELGIEKKKVKVEKRKRIVAVGLGILAVISTIFILK